jgi:glutaminyl-peptide cyclotransferase
VKRLLILLLCCCTALTVQAQQLTPTPPPSQPVEVLLPGPVGYPHDSSAYTQGLLLHDGWLYESAGQYGESSLRRVELATGEVVQRFDVTRANLEAVGWLDEFEAACTLTALDHAYRGEVFAEGLALVGERLIQLTWQEECALVYDRETFELVDILRYDDTDQIDQGWGLCYDGEVLYMSDGSANLYIRDAETFERLDTVAVTYRGDPLMRLNELECVGGDVWANVYQTEFIVRIDKATGVVTAIVDASNLLLPEEQVGIDVLNGIAYVPERNTFLITGKYWSRLFEVRFVLVGLQ